MTTLAIIGTGVAGLACAHFLHSRYAVTLYEKNYYVGGHTNTITVDEEGHDVKIDTGFMVYNEVTYPNLTRFFREINVETKPTSMSFSVQYEPAGLEYNGTSLNHLFGQRSNLANPRFWRLLMQINRFNGDAVKSLNDPDCAAQTVRQYVTERGYGEDFLNLYLVPMSSAVWSTPPDAMLDFPAMTLLRFFHNHGFLGLKTQHPWRTLVGGAQSYVRKMSIPWRGHILQGHKAVRVVREAGKARIFTGDGTSRLFDKVIIAAHADEALNMIASPTGTEARLLREFKYQPNTATLHTDPSFMPKTKLCWASWNYRMDAEAGGGAKVQPSTHYWMNSLQGVSRRKDYFVSLNVHDRIAPDKVLRKIDYTHPLFNLGAIAAQKELPALNTLSPSQSVYYCGSYFKYGFHEDAFTSGLDCARAVTGERIWS